MLDLSTSSNMSMKVEENGLLDWEHLSAKPSALDSFLDYQDVLNSNMLKEEDVRGPHEEDHETVQGHFLETEDPDNNIEDFLETTDEFYSFGCRDPEWSRQSIDYQESAPLELKELGCDTQSPGVGEAERLLNSFDRMIYAESLSLEKKKATGSSKHKKLEGKPKAKQGRPKKIKKQPLETTASLACKIKNDPPVVVVEMVPSRVDCLTDLMKPPQSFSKSPTRESEKVISSTAALSVLIKRSVPSASCSVLNFPSEKNENNSLNSVSNPNSKGNYVGIYSPSARKDRIRRYHEKRKRRVWKKRIKYDCRKKLADDRPRVKGRFVRVCDSLADVPKPSNNKPPKINPKSLPNAMACNVKMMDSNVIKRNFVKTKSAVAYNRALNVKNTKFRALSTLQQNSLLR